MIVLNVFGRAVGNLIAQQYGLSSDALDVTGDPQVAAFFATRRYPTYRHFPGDRGHALGVMYRIPRWSDPPSVASIDKTLSVIGLELDDARGLAWFEHRIHAAGILFRYGKAKLEELLKKYALDQDFAVANLATQALRITDVTLLRCYEAKCSEVGLTVSLERSRAMRQKGGMLFPSVVHECRIPSKISLTPLGRPKEYAAHPPTVFMLRPIAVGNTMHTRGLQAFFFRHGHDSVDEFTPEDLWPGPETDGLLGVLVAVMQEKLQHYLADKRVGILDFQHGIIDPRYERDEGDG